MSDHEKVELILASGQRVAALVTYDQLDDGGFENVEDYVRQQVTTPVVPHWTTIGDVDLFTQALHAWRAV